MLTVLTIVLGAALVCVVLWDIAVTVLHPTHRGLPSYLGNEAAWRVVRGLSRATGQRRVLTVAGPVAMAASFLAWVGTLWVGFALVYLPAIELEEGLRRTLPWFREELRRRGELP